MTEPSLRLEVRPYEDPDVVALVAAVQAEYVVRYGGPDDAVVEPDEFAPPDGLFLVALLDGRPVGMGGWRRREDQPDDKAVEIKRMYVVADMRGRGLARRILAELELRAAQAGRRRVVLNTGNEQPEAIGLYESSGYAPGAAFGHYADVPGALFYEKELS